MANEPSIRDSDDKPVLNTFGLPAVCPVHDAETPDPCCDLCTDWVYCIKQIPISVTLPGFDFSNWLPGVSMSANKILSSSFVGSAEFSGTDGTNEFDGTFLMLPHSEELTVFDCNRRPYIEQCNDDFDNGFGGSYGVFAGYGLFGWFGFWWGYYHAWLDETAPGTYDFYDWYDDFYYQYYGTEYPGTHFTTQPRTVIAPAAIYGTIKDFYIDLSTECVLNDEDEPCLRFVLLLRIEWEKPTTGGCIGCTDGIYGVDACDPAVLDEIEDAEDWGTAPDEYKSCLPLLESALIPLAGLVWGDLANVPLTAIAPPEFTLVDASPYEPDYWTITGGSVGGGRFPELGLFKEIGWSTGFEVDCDEENAENIACGGTTSSGIHGRHSTGNTCPSDVWMPVGCSYGYSSGVFGSICVPDAITLNEGDAFLSVLGAAGCNRPIGCKTCIPDEENPHLAQQIKDEDVYFTWTEGSTCAKTFTPILPDCLDIVEVYWSWGGYSVGRNPIDHTIRNLAPDSLTQKQELITMTAVDSRGCLYCHTQLVGCGCCDGISGSLTLAQLDEEGCVYSLTAEISNPENCGQPFIEYQLIAAGEGCPATFDECDCAEVDPEAYICERECSGSLGDGGFTVITISGYTRLRYRVWDSLCGCASDWIETDLYCTNCEQCEGKLVAIRLTVSGVADVPENGCTGDCGTAYNKTYEVRPFNSVDDCVWTYTEDDVFVCTEFDIYHVFVSTIIGCENRGLGNPAIPELVATASITGAGGATWEGIVIDADCPGDCSDLSMNLTRIDWDNNVCDFSGANAVLEIITVA